MYYIHHNDKELPLCIDYAVIRKFNAKNGITKLSQFANVDYDDLNNLETLLLYALERGHKLEGKEFNLSQDDVVDIFSTKGILFFSDIIAESFPRFSTGTDPVKKN